MIDLREKDRLRIIDIAKRVLNPGCEIWAYGSRVKGTNYDASDLDLAIITPAEQPLDPNTLADFKLALQDSNIPILIQVMDWQRIPESFRQNILTRYEVLLDL
jgi:predicted nucleotidyltransferase